MRYMRATSAVWIGHVFRQEPWLDAPPRTSDVTMVDECKQSTSTSTTHVKKNFQVNTFHGGLKAWMDLYRHCVCPGSYLKYAFSIYVTKLWQLNRGIPSRSWRYLICIITRGLCSYNARLLNDDSTAIEVSYWRRRESPNYTRLHRGRMSTNSWYGIAFMIWFMGVIVAQSILSLPLSCFSISPAVANLL